MPQNYVEGSEPIPGYRLVSFLGEGGFGKVWKATAPGGAEVALKIIQLGGTQGRKEFRALQRVKRVRHPNLIPVTAFWLKNDDGDILDDVLTEQKNLPTNGDATDVAKTLAPSAALDADRPTELIIAMGLGDGSLMARLEECRLQGLDGIPVDELLSYMEHCAEGLDFLHRPIHQFDGGEAAIQHCDIKPHNLLIVGGAVQICDFGLARVMGAAQTTTDSASTIAYVAPEFLKDGAPSLATDQYSLAVTYFELRTGQLPYSSNTFVGVANAVMEGSLELSKLPAPERNVIRKATAPNPIKRYETVAQMVAALRGAIDGTPVATSKPSGGLRFRVLLGAAAIVAVVAVVALLAVQRFAPDRLPRFLVWDDVDKVVEPVDIPGDIPVEEGGGRADIPVEDRVQVDVGPPEVDPTPVEPTPDPLFDPIAQLIELGQPDSYNEAIQSIQAAIDRGETDGRLWRLWGLAHLGLQDAEQAVLDFTQAFDRTADHVDLVHRGGAYYEQGLYDEAAIDFNTAIDHFETRLTGSADDVRQSYAAAYLGRGTILYIQGDVSAALADLNVGSSHDPENFRFFSRLGSFHMNLNTPDDSRLAADYFGRAVKLEPSDLDYVNQGRAYQNLNECDSAQAAFEAAIQLNPGNAEAYYLSGDCYLKQQPTRYDPAIERFTPAIDLYQSYYEEGGGIPLFDLQHAHFYRATCYWKTGQFQEAADDLDWIVEQPGDLPVEELITLIASLADAMAEVGRRDEAVEWIQRVIEQASEADRRQYREKLQRFETPAK